MFHWFKK